MFKSNSSFVNIHVKVNCFSLVYHIKYIINLYIHKKHVQIKLKLCKLTRKSELPLACILTSNTEILVSNSKCTVKPFDAEKKIKLPYQIVSK